MVTIVLRYIKQRRSSKCLKARRNTPPETTITAKKAWRRTNKQDIRKACYKQQQGLCAYTELSLDDTELGCHLEHIAPRSSHPELTFASDNIILSTLDDVQSGTLLAHERFGGHYKSEKYSADWFISPFNRRCTDFFAYEVTGVVNAAAKLDIEEKIKADKTIETLNLNADYLVERRGRSLRALKGEIESLEVKYTYLNLSNLPVTSKEVPADFAQLIHTTLEPIDRQLPEFYSAKKQLFERYGFSPLLPP